ncbi:MAG: NAD(P)H-dependent oxidoreductase [Oscillospiraceae bacterium]|nr:NAD(P)H-dependent oxidoreductase [Oscillospiraceae bacterium]
MKKILLVILSLFMIVMLTACSGNSSEPSAGGNTSTSNSEPASRPDSAVSENNNSSEPVSDNSAISDGNSASDTSSDANSDQQSEDISKKVLVAYFSATGTTKALAEYAAEAMKADIYEIAPAQPYTSADLNYSDKNSRSTKEMNDPSSRPEINGSVSNMSDYDIIFLGYPIWWGEAPRIINTFMESYDFSGKTIVPFCTSSSSGLGSSAKNLHSLCAGSVNWLDGARLSGSTSRGDMAAWINGLGLDVTAE